jgi:hypothetical protein
MIDRLSTAVSMVVGLVLGVVVVAVSVLATLVLAILSGLGRALAGGVGGLQFDQRAAGSTVRNGTRPSPAR